MDTMRERVTSLILNTGGSPEVVAGILAIVAEDREKLVAALEMLTDGLDANTDGRDGLTNEQWDRAVALARSALASVGK